MLCVDVGELRSRIRVLLVRGRVAPLVPRELRAWLEGHPMPPHHRTPTAAKGQS